MSLVTLSAGACRAVIDPALGASLLAFTCEGREILRAATAGIDDPRMSACFPLVPFCNRLARGALRFGRRTIVLPPNARDVDEPAHGYGWMSPWRIVARDVASIMLSHDGASTPWPWAYLATQVVTLDPGGLTIDLSLTNRAAEAAPVGLGLHPYFPAQGLQHACLGIPPEERGDAHMLIPAALEGVNHCYGAWTGRAELIYADHAVTLSARGASRLQVFKPAGGDFLCLEPVMNRPIACDLVRAGLVKLEPHDTCRISMRIEVACLV